MDKKNNEGKTFGDIFSKVEEKKINFNDVKEEVIDKKDDSKEDNNLFDDSNKRIESSNSNLIVSLDDSDI